MFTADTVTWLKCACLSTLKFDGLLSLISILQWMSAKLQHVNRRKWEQLINVLPESVSEVGANWLPVVTYAVVSGRICAKKPRFRAAELSPQNEAKFIGLEELALSFIIRPGFAWGLWPMLSSWEVHVFLVLERWYFFSLCCKNGKGWQKTIFRHIDWRNIFL